MTNAVRFVVGCAAALAATLCVSTVIAQHPSSGSDLYGRGVDAYFSGSSAEAEQFLGQAIAQLPDDPRPYYFRALALLRAGRSDEARSDMETGAALEARRPKQFAIGMALERVQGSDRLLLEQFRRQGRSAAASQRDEQIRGRYDQRVESDDSRLLREPTASSQTIQRQPVPATTSSAGNPFADEAPKPQPQVERPSDPFATGDGGAAAKPQSGPSATAGKVPSSKLLGVLGRVLGKSVPLPSVEGLRNKLPQTTPTPGSDRGTSNTKPDAKQSAKPLPTNNTEDPFGGP
jgi:tetratricopeptide (TPR) repeat protein